MTFGIATPLLVAIMLGAMVVVQWGMWRLGDSEVAKLMPALLPVLAAFLVWGRQVAAILLYFMAGNLLLHAHIIEPRFAHLRQHGRRGRR